MNIKKKLYHEGTKKGVNTRSRYHVVLEDAKQKPRSGEITVEKSSQ